MIMKGKTLWLCFCYGWWWRWRWVRKRTRLRLCGRRKEGSWGVAEEQVWHGRWFDEAQVAGDRLSNIYIFCFRTTFFCVPKSLFRFFLIFFGSMGLLITDNGFKPINRWLLLSPPYPILARPIFSQNSFCSDYIIQNFTTLLYLNHPGGSWC